MQPRAATMTSTAAVPTTTTPTGSSGAHPVAKRTGPLGKVGVLFREEFGLLFSRRRAVDLLAGVLPAGAFPRLRAAVYRLAGVQTGRGTMILSRLELSITGDPSKIRIGDRTRINAHVFIDSGADVIIGDDVAIGHHAVLVTTGHEIGTGRARSGAHRKRPIKIENGAWIGARATILPGVTIGHGAVVAAGALVTRDVPADTLVGGVPAHIIRKLEEEDLDA